MKIETLRAELAETEKRSRVLQRRIDKMFVGLPKAAGLKSVDALIERLLPFSSGRLRINGAPRAEPEKVDVREKTPGTVASGDSPSGSRKVRRAGQKGKRHSQAVQDKAKALLVSGKTAAATAVESGASMATINLWKRRWGLVKKRHASKAK